MHNKILVSILRVLLHDKHVHILTESWRQLPDFPSESQGKSCETTSSPVNGDEDTSLFFFFLGLLALLSFLPRCELTLLVEEAREECPWLMARGGGMSAL